MMTLNTHKRRASGIFILAFGALAACGGSTTVVTSATTPALAAFNDATSQQSAALAAASLDATARTTTGLTGTLNRAANTAIIGTLTGTINASRTDVALTGGGTVTLLPGANTYSARYIATPTTGNRTLGVTGAATPTASLPTGTATMTGPATVTIQNGTLLFDLMRDASIAANFGTGRVTTTLNGLDGDVSNGGSVVDAATITITGSPIITNTFSGGTISMTSNTIAPLTAAAVTSVNGTFFGPSGQEAGGVILVDDTATGNVRIFGDFIGK
jgi:hypothetical protein